MSNSFSNLHNMAHGRWYPTAIVLPNGSVMVFSGLKETGPTNNTVEIYNLRSGWGPPLTAPWTPPLYPRMHVLPNGNVFYSGPSINSSIYNPLTNSWSVKVAVTNFTNPRTYGSSVLLPLTPANNYAPKVMIFGGHNPATNTTEIIELSAPTLAWKWGPPMSQPRIEMNAVILPTGKILALGGSAQDETASTASLNADLYDPVAGTFSSAGANAYPRMYHSNAMLLPDATVALAGSNPARGNYEPHLEIYQPAYLFTTDGNGNVIPATQPTIASAPPTVSYAGAFSVQTPDAASIASVVLVRASAVTHAFDMDQRLVGLNFTAGAGTLNVTGPPNANIAPPGYYLLFLVNSAGVPSVANFVQVFGPPDYTLTVTPATKTANDGSSISFSVNVAPAWNYTGQVSLNVAGLPAGAVGTFSSNPTIGGISNLAITKTSNAVAGNYRLTITATDGTITHTASVTLSLKAFAISATPSSQILPIGGTTTYTITITPQNGFNSVVNFSKVGLPSGVTASFNPSSVTGSGTSTLTLTAATTALPTTKSFTVTGTSGNMSRSVSLSVTVQ
jgi:hypothetical protein